MGIFAKLNNYVDLLLPFKIRLKKNVINSLESQPKNFGFILLLEKNWQYLKAQKIELENSGYHVTACNNWAQAIDVIQNSKDLDLVLFDINFLQDKDATQWISTHDITFNIPFLFLYDGSNSKIIPYYNKITAFGLIEKNTPNSILLSIIQIAIQRHSNYKKLIDSEKKLRFLFDNSLDGVSLFEEDKVCYFSNGIISMLGYDRKEILNISKDQIFSLIHKEDVSRIQETIETAHRELKKFFKYSFRVKTKKGNYLWVEDFVHVEYDSQGNHSRSCIYTRDINERKQNEEKIQKLLEEKEIILKEVHHRIKNNMSTIIALLNLQADSLQIPQATSAFEETSRRIRSMMVLYDKLYRSSDYKVLSIQEYLLTLIDDIVNTFPNREQVEIEKSISDFPISTDKLVPLGIIITELLTNTMKYAFVGRREGRIAIQAYKKDELVVCIIQDNGSSLPESIDFKNSTGFGLSLVEMLNKQLYGNLKIERLNGTKIILEFKL